MRRLAFALGLFGLVGVSGFGMGPARADDIPDPPPPSAVKADVAAVQVQDNGDGTRQIEWVCTGVVEGTVATATGVNCEVKQGLVVLDKSGVATPFNVTSTKPRTLTVPNGAYQICAVARAFMMNGEVYPSARVCKAF